MARIDNATVMQCDRCGRNKWYKDLDDPDIKTWYNVNRLDSTGTGHDYLRPGLQGIREQAQGL